MISKPKNHKHLSIGQICFNKQGEIAIIRRDEEISLPTETPKKNEKIQKTLKRGAKEELGIKIRTGQYIGDITKETKSSPNTTMIKTEIYFITYVKRFLKKATEKDTLEDKIEWLTPQELYSEMKIKDDIYLDILKEII